LSVAKLEDFGEWYTQLVQRAELADIRYNVKGFVVFRPWAVRMMNRMFQLFEKELEEKGHQPTLFPALIPESNFRLESEHVEGFLPEVFWVTEAGGSSEKLEERLALRPTSETAMYRMYALWVRSWRDLPLKLYQRGQVWRYEGKATRPFIRGREFYWIETHNAFGTEEEALAQVKEDMGITEKIVHGDLGIPLLFFQRPEHDKFAGAVHTYAADTLMPDGRVLQLPSTHLLGQNFSKPFGIAFLDQRGDERHVWQTCYGPAISRLVAAVISIHGDDKGLVLPPKIAPVQVIIVPILTQKAEKDVLEACAQVKNVLKSSGILAEVDDRREYTPGWKFNEWELRGVPLRVEVGPRDLRENRVILVRRDTGEKTPVQRPDVTSQTREALDKIQANLATRADEAMRRGTRTATNFVDLKETLNGDGGFVRIAWCGREDCAKEIQEETSGGVIRGTLVEGHENVSSTCVHCGRKASQTVYVSKQY
jgi:prolyl-tRNA synthetase